MPTFSSSYSAIVATGQQLFVTQRDNQTQFTLTSTAPGQQQSQSSSLTTGAWRSPPTLYCTTNGVILQICAEQDLWFQLQGQQMQRMNAAPIVLETDRVTLEPAEAPPAMQPLPPMQMGNMEMQPMQMKMGSMEMSMGKPANSNPTAKFCAECGHPVEPSDRFCTICGHQLNP